MSNSAFVMPSSPNDVEKIKKAIKECSDSKTRIDAEKEFIDDVAADIKDEFGMSKSTFSKLVATYHRQNYSEVTAKAEEFEFIYETVFPTEK